MFKKLFKNKPIGFYFSLVASLISLFLTIFYAAYMTEHDLFNAGVFILYLLAFLMPLVYFFVGENNLTRLVPVFQTLFLALAFGILLITVGAYIVYYLTGSLSLASTTASGEVLLALFVITLITVLIVFVASFMRQTKKLSAEQQAEVDESWTEFKAAAVKHKKPLIISGASVVALIVILVLLFALIIPQAMIVHVDNVKFGQSDVVMYETETLKLDITVSPDNAENKKVSYSSSDEKVATVSSAGLVKAVGIGKTTIKVTSEDGEHSAECSVEVKELTVAETNVVEMPDTVHYVKGEEFDDKGISIVATLTNGKTEKISTRQHKLAYDVETVNAKMVPVTATYEYRGKSFNTTFNVYGDVAEVDDVEAFNAAYENTEEYGYLRCTQPLEFDTLAFDSDIIVEGVLSADAVTVSDGAEVTVIGRVNDFTQDGEGDLFTVSGEGTLDIQTVYGDEKDSDPNGPMERDKAGLYVTNGLSVSGVALTTTGIHVDSGDFEVSDGADVTVFGPGYIKNEIYNGIDLYNGKLLVDGEETRLAVYNTSSLHASRAAVECKAITVDNGAEFVIGGTEDNNSLYYYAVYCGSSDCVMTVDNGSSAKVEAYNIGSVSSQCLWGVKELNVLGGSAFEMNAVNYFSTGVSGRFEKDTDITVNGTVFDMSKTVGELRFGDMALADYTVEVDADAAYEEGDTFDGTGILLNAVFGSGQLEVQLESGFEAIEKVLVAGWNTVEVKVGEETIECEIFADYAAESIATVSTTEEFDAALANENYKCIVVSSELTFDALTINRDILIDGNVKVNSLTVVEGVTLSTKGRIWSDGDMTISGGGTVDATMYAPSGLGIREEYAAIRTVSGKLTINDATTVECNNLATGGALEISGGARVTVYGKNARVSDKGVNGIHSSGQSVTVSGEGTELNVLYDDTVFGTSPAAIEAATVTVDGAKLNVGTTTGVSWGFGIWFEGGDNKTITTTNSANVSFDVPDTHGNSVFGNCSGIYVRDGSTFTVITQSSGFQNDLVKEGTVNWTAS